MRKNMLLANKNAIIYGGAGDVGGAVARAFAREGARVFLAGRTAATLEAAASEIRAAGGLAETTQVDAYNLHSVEQSLSSPERDALIFRLTPLVMMTCKDNPS
jgi:3-oxoacyl-[acyl-carrier protein] reductase